MSDETIIIRTTCPRDATMPADIVPAGVALSHKSRWLSTQRANINALNPGRKTDMAESSAVHSVEIMLTKM